jgi:hypothetical protein
MSDAPLPAQIGRYQIRSLIGRGGMGQVYGAFDPSLDRLVALKTIVAGSDNPQFVERLQREARACGRLHHPGIVTIHDLGESDGKVFIAMEWLQGQNLADALGSGALTFEAKIQALIEILDALAYAHAEGIIHRDIKPSNVWVLPNGRIKLLDFGLARLAQVDALTLPGEVMGTPHYMSPEQLMGHQVDPRTDVFSTGVLGYELFAHRRAFDGESVTAVIIQVLQNVPAPIETAWIAAFPEVESILLTAMAKSPGERYASAQEMAAALRAFVEIRKDDIKGVDQGVRQETAEAVTRARSLVTAGQTAEATQLLTTALRRNPEASEVRELLADPTVVLQPPRPEAPRAVSRATGPAMAPAAVQPVYPSTPPPRMAVAPPPAVPARDPVSPVAPTIPRETRPASLQQSPWIWTIAAAIVIVVGVGAYYTIYSPASTTPAPLQSTPSQSTPAPVVPVATPPPAASPAAPPVVQPQGQPATVGSGNQATPAAPSPAPAGFYVTDSTPAALRPLLIQHLEQAGVRRRDRQQDAAWVISATAEIETRQGLAGTSALTADYTGTIDIRGRGANRSFSKSFDGHAMEFGAAVVRAKAARELAQKMADYVSEVVK